ncbi:MAG TPA: ribokinase [Gammaproteobacteria bacterium]|nr:ribokinase [Gammaproteobacteria bacterium]|tara:strand:+ start:9503 stop:10468 length:966 start_codon:yes stop_codon:yes gene_type:complete
MATTSQIMVIGSINTDLVVNTGKLPSPGETVLGDKFYVNQGGKGANQAVAAARLGANVSMVGCVGSDDFGKQAVAGLTAENVDCAHIARVKSVSTGVALISVDRAGINQITVSPGANNYTRRETIDQAFNDIPQEPTVLLQLEIPVDSVQYAVQLGRARNCRVILDPAPAQKLSGSLYKNVSLITPNASEAAALTGVPVTDVSEARKAANKLQKLGCENIILTLGEAGALVQSNGTCTLIKAPKVVAHDTTAAGDCFNGALATALTEGAELIEAVKFACHAAAMSVTKQGAQSSMPKRGEIACSIEPSGFNEASDCTQHVF